MKIVMTNKTRKELENDLDDAQPFHTYWIKIDADILTIEFSRLEDKNKEYQFKIEEEIK